MKEKIVCSDEPLPEDFAALNELKAICKSVSGRTADFPVISGGGWKQRCVRMTTGRPRGTASKVDVNKRSRFKDYVSAYNVRNENQLINTWLNKLDGVCYNLDVQGVGVFPLMMQIIMWEADWVSPIKTQMDSPFLTSKPTSTLTQSI